jgi:hypothetical protein
MTGYPAVQFFEKATVGGLVRGTLSRHWLGIQMDGNQAGLQSRGKKKWNQTFQLDSIIRYPVFLLVLQPGETTSSKFFGLQVHFSRLSRQQMP